MRRKILIGIAALVFLCLRLRASASLPNSSDTIFACPQIIKGSGLAQEYLLVAFSHAIEVVDEAIMTGIILGDFFSAQESYDVSRRAAQESGYLEYAFGGWNGAAIQPAC